MTVFSELTVPASRREEMRLLVPPVKPLRLRVGVSLRRSIARYALQH